MNDLIKNIYLYCCFYAKDRITQKPEKQRYTLLRHIWSNENAYDFVERYFLPGNDLYGMMIKERNRRIKEKINDGIIIV